MSRQFHLSGFISQRVMIPFISALVLALSLAVFMGIKFRRDKVGKLRNALGYVLIRFMTIAGQIQKVNMGGGVRILLWKQPGRDSNAKCQQ